MRGETIHKVLKIGGVVIFDAKIIDNQRKRDGTSDMTE